MVNLLSLPEDDLEWTKWNAYEPRMTAVEADEMPPGWEEVPDASTGRTHYCHTDGRTSWDRSKVVELPRVVAENVVRKDGKAVAFKPAFVEELQVKYKKAKAQKIIEFLLKMWNEYHGLKRSNGYAMCLGVFWHASADRPLTVEERGEFFVELLAGKRG